MSYHTWHYYGYGICVDQIKVDSVERIETLLTQAPNYRQEIHKWFEDCEIVEPTVDDYMEFDQDFHMGLATILKKVIEEAENIELLSCDNYEGASFLLYPPVYPWQMSAKDLDLTEEKLISIFRKYVNILTDKPIELDYQSVGNGG